MAFNKTYEDFLNEMVAVTKIKDLIDDDFFLDTVLLLAYKRTVLQLGEEYDDDEDDMLKRWDELRPLPTLDSHFGWLSAGKALERLNGANHFAVFEMFSSLSNAITSFDKAGHLKRAVDKWEFALPHVYA